MNKKLLPFNEKILLKSFRNVAVAEGISFLLLLGVAMPIKYLYDVHQPVKYIGWIHGFLFMSYIVLLLMCWIKYKWKFLIVLGFLFASLIPFFPFIVENALQREDHYK